MRRDAHRAKRPPLARMLRIHEELTGGRYPNSTRLAHELEVTVKTIHRDLEFMRHSLNLPIEYDDVRHGFYYTEKVRAFPSMQISEGELVSLVVAEKALQQYRGTSFEKPLLSALDKISQALPDTISVSLTDVQQTISFRTRTEAIVDLGVFDRLSRATARRQQIELMYRKPGQKQPESRVVDPYHLANINGEWYLFAYDHLRRDIRTFVPTRVASLKLTGKTFKRPQRFSVEGRLKHSFGVHSAEGDFEVKIRFSPRVADYIREKKWHESQASLDLPDGGIELRMRLSSLKEVQRWVLSWAGDAVVLQPPELIESIRGAAESLLKSHQL